MNRRIFVSVGAPPAPAEGGLGVLATRHQPDSYSDRFVKLVPTESIAAYPSLVGLLSTAPAGGTIAAWVLFVLLLILTPLYLAKRTTKKGDKLPVGQLMLSSFAFVVWAYTVGGPFATLDWYHPFWGSLAMLTVSALSPLLVSVFPANRS